MPHLKWITCYLFVGTWPNNWSLFPYCSINFLSYVCECVCVCVYIYGRSVTSQAAKGSRALKTAAASTTMQPEQIKIIINEKKWLVFDFISLCIFCLMCYNSSIEMCFPLSKKKKEREKQKKINNRAIATMHNSWTFPSTNRTNWISYKICIV